MFEMRFSYNMLIISILLVCIWFAYVSVESKAYYRRAFRLLMWVGVLMYVNRLFGIAMEENYITYHDNMIITERAIHYVLTFAVYSLYAYFMLCLLNQFHYYPMWKKIGLFVPVIIMDILILTSPWTHLIFYVQDGVAYEGRAFWALPILQGTYAISATIHALRKRRLYPRIFGECVIVVAVFAVVQFLVRLFFKDETLYYSTLIINIILFLLALTVVEFYKDNVTGLFNQEAFEQYIQKEISRKCNRAIYLVKLKNYTYLKDNCYELSLTEIVKELADIIKEYSKLASVYYINDGRYVVVVHKRDKFTEKEFLEKMQKRLEAPFSLNGANVQISLFIAVINLENEKINKDNFYKYFTACDDMKYRSNDVIEIIRGDNFGIDQMQRYHKIEEAIERALVEKEFRMFYQPIVEVATGRIVSAEALIRLNDRVLGFVSPEEFISISESNGKILAISEFVIDSVFRFIKEHDLKELGIQFIELNLSVMQCMDKNLTEKLEYYIQRYEIDPKQVNLEITETATNFDEDRLKAQLERIKKLGFSFSLDDYGTGYSNLVRVMEYPVDIIKLDKSIVWSAFHDRDNFVTLKNLIGMFHDVRRKIVAEGVESEEQMNALKELGCDYIQGYFYSKPINEEKFIDFVTRYHAKLTKEV